MKRATMVLSSMILPETVPTTMRPKARAATKTTAVLASVLLALLLSALPSVSLRADRTATEFERLRQIEGKLVEAIERARNAFVFIQGGSGFIISSDGHILTNNHVISDQRGRVRDPSRPIPVFLRGGKQAVAKLLGRDPRGDVALLQLSKPPGIDPLKFGDSDALLPGQSVFALGDPFLVGSENLFLRTAPPSYEPAASFGVVSAVHRFSDGYTDAIQVDVAVNRGNSGGPLLTLDGRVVGINGKIETRFGIGVNTGVGYAIPSNQIQRFFEPLKKAAGGIVYHGTIPGLEVATRITGRDGLLIEEVAAGSTAAKSGLKEGDRIVTIGGHRVFTSSRLHGILGTYPAGSTVPLRLRRDGEVVEVVAPLVRPGRPYLGLRIQTEDDSDIVRVSSVVGGGPAFRAGVRENDIIVKINDQAVKTAADLKLELRKHVAGDEIVLLLRRKGKDLRQKVRLGGHKEF